ncbi:hypothetical protein SAY86_026202 [Trapa natans]|uniref:Mitochondrial intermembrane space import and assembly protein 40 homolog n=1 Tax=Trapa natans TaxID=22666 RepID=A0AAN7KLB0_TRANT|nr:hypothetical protein SAY86_026202 [Trapa natans]
MGQVQSEAAASEEISQNSEQPAAVTAAPPRSMDALLSEAAAYGSDEAESLDAMAQKALECPCIADLRNGPCGTQFSDAFVCFLKSTSEEKGSDCVNPFIALQKCIKANPGAFSKDVLEEDDQSDMEGEEQPQREYKIYPPKWSRESPSSPGKSKL